MATIIFLQKRETVLETDLNTIEHNLFSPTLKSLKDKALQAYWELQVRKQDPFSLFSSGSQRRRSLSLPVLTLIFPALLPCLVRDSLCTALQTKILWINWSLNAIDTIETWVSGNLTALTERSQRAIRWTRGRGGESCVWRLFPWRTLISTFSEP